ncbi:MAG TPA: hypothetical protein VF203_10380 [Burkholderiales bacterium]
MRTRHPLALSALLLCCGFLLGSPAHAQEAGESVVKQGHFTRDLYLAGGTVEVLASVEGDVIAAGGQVTVDNTVTGDVMAAGGTVSVRARVADDVRIAGGNVTLAGSVGDHAVIAGGHVLLAPGSSVGGRAWLAGNSINVGGKIGGNLRAAGARITIAGDVGGDVVLYAESVEIASGATIRGNLTYHSRDPARIASDATIAGKVTRQRLGPSEEMREGARAAAGAARVALYVSLTLTAIVLYLLFPKVSAGAVAALNDSPLKALGLGLALLAATPLVIVLLFASLVGVWLALTVVALYLLFLLLGFLTGVVSVGDWGLRLVGQDDRASTGLRVLSIVAAFVVLWMVRWVPVLGSLAMFALLVFGLGALTLHLWRRYVTA